MSHLPRLSRKSYVPKLCLYPRPLVHQFMAEGASWKGLLCPFCNVVTQKNEIKTQGQLGELVSKIRDLESWVLGCTSRDKRKELGPAKWAAETQSPNQPFSPETILWARKLHHGPRGRHGSSSLCKGPTGKLMDVTPGEKGHVPPSGPMRRGSLMTEAESGDPAPTPPAIWPILTPAPAQWTETWNCHLFLAHIPSSSSLIIKPCLWLSGKSQSVHLMLASLLLCLYKFLQEEGDRRHCFFNYNTSCICFIFLQKWKVKCMQF